MQEASNNQYTAVTRPYVAAQLCEKVCDVKHTSHKDHTSEKLQSFTDDLVTPLKATYWCETVVRVRPVRCLLHNNTHTLCQLVNREI